jgi:phosphatidylglycerophosphatase A
MWALLFWLNAKTLFVYVLAFLLFRVFDIAKPFGIRLCDQSVKGGLGIMLDDLLAAILAAGCGYAILWGLNICF